MTTNQTQQALRECPLCKGRAQTIKGAATSEVWKHGAFWRVFCTICQLRQLFYRTEADAISAWNARTPTAPQPLLDALTAANDALVVAISDIIYLANERNELPRFKDTTDQIAVALDQINAALEGM